LDKSLQLLAYALKLKGVVVDTPCQHDRHTIDLTPFKWPVTQVIQLTNAPAATTKAPEPEHHESEHHETEVLFFGFAFFFFFF
jgi:hypothetical protein